MSKKISKKDDKLGRVCYEAFDTHAIRRDWSLPLWDDCNDDTKRAWIGAAKGVAKYIKKKRSK